MEASIQPLQERLEVLERTSLQTLANDANDVLQSGWNTLLGAVSKELEQAKTHWGEVWKELEQMEIPEMELPEVDEPTEPQGASANPNADSVKPSSSGSATPMNDG